MEKNVIVDNKGIIKRISEKKELTNSDNIAAELVLVYIPESRKIVLFNRGRRASDMIAHWSLQSGKINASDLSEPIEQLIGRKLPLDTYKNAAIREFREELTFNIVSEDLHFVDEFHMAFKQLYFTLLSLAIEEKELKKLSFHNSELDNFKLFTCQEFENNEHLGDAIVYHKKKILQHVDKVFGD